MTAAVDGWVPWPHPSPLLDAIGGFEARAGDAAAFGFTVDEHKVNRRGMLHAGAIAAIADVAIGHALAASSGSTGAFVTVNLSCDLVGAAALGERVEGVVTPTRVGRRLAAGTATFRTDRTIATVSALFLAS